MSIQEYIKNIVQEREEVNVDTPNPVTEEHIKLEALGMMNNGYLPNDTEAYEKLSQFLAYRRLKVNRKGLFLYGNTGVGKTLWMKKFSDAKITPAKEIVNKWVDCGASEVLDWMNPKDNYDTTYPGYYDICIDDVGDEPLLNNYGTKEQVICQAIDARSKRFNMTGYNKGFTYFTSNLNLEEIKERYKDRTYSRLIEMCTFIEIKGKDFRVTN